MPARIARSASLSIAKALSFVVGRDPTGCWVVIEEAGRGGGYFRDQKSAVQYAEFESDHRPGAVRLSRRPLMLRF